MGTSETERVAIQHALELERRSGHTSVDVHLGRLSYDISSPPRKIEVKASGGSARGAAIPLEERQVQAANQDPDNFYVYVVDHVTPADQGSMEDTQTLASAVLLWCSDV